MLLFLIGLYYDPTLKAFFDGDHISTWNDKFIPSPRGGQLLPLEAWSYNELVTMFQDLSDDEKEILRTYYE